MKCKEFSLYHSLALWLNVLLAAILQIVAVFGSKYIFVFLLAHLLCSDASPSRQTWW